jgi:hypothetical protein
VFWKKKAHFCGHYVFLKRLPAATLRLVKHPTTTKKNRRSGHVFTNVGWLPGLAN